MLKKILTFLLTSLFFVSCSSVTDKSTELLTELVDALKPVYIKAKKLSESKKITREYKAKYIKEFNRIFSEKLNKNISKYAKLIQEFYELDKKAKMSASVEFNNSYYDASGEYDEEEDEKNQGVITNIAFYELLSEHRTIVSVNSEFHDELKKEITLRRFEAIILRAIVATYKGGNFNTYVTGLIDGILNNMLMQRLPQYKKQQEMRLKSMKSFLKPFKFNLMIEKRALQAIEKTKGLMSVFVKRYVKKDLEKKLGENFINIGAERIKAACLQLIMECDKFVNEKTPIFEKEKKSLNAYRAVFNKEYPVLENLVKRWKKLNPIFSYANQTRSIQ